MLNGCRRTRIGALAVVVLVAALWPRVARACAVCFGDGADSGFIRGAQWATVLMVGLTYTVLSGGALLFIVLRRRGRRLNAIEPTHRPPERTSEQEGVE